MSVSLKRANRHVTEWGAKLAKFPGASWPRNLFHHCQAEVAVAILNDGTLKCRNRVTRLICDVANQAALGNNQDAHAYARLYFRPKNWFHFKTEGIKSSTDQYRVNPHMGMPVALVFDFIGVMTRDDVAFVYGNFAKTLASPQSGDKAFDRLDFSLIYHDGPLPKTAVGEVNNIRMSEVVVREKLDLRCFSHAICRTPHEARTLEYLLLQASVNPPRITVEQPHGSMFMRKGIFIDEIYTMDGKLFFKFHAPLNATREKYDVTLTKMGEWNRAYSLGSATLWRIRDADSKPDTVWQVENEGCLAYLGDVPGAPAEGRLVP